MSAARHIRQSLWQAGCTNQGIASQWAHSPSLSKSLATCPAKLIAEEAQGSSQPPYRARMDCCQLFLSVLRVPHNPQSLRRLPTVSLIAAESATEPLGVLPTSNSGVSLLSAPRCSISVFLCRITLKAAIPFLRSWACFYRLILPPNCFCHSRKPQNRKVRTPELE